mmetsp:Transcript_38751/g.84555  ORF Transcript_38751/g.84555 Transcript_38751/m.84555 type:complete len:305 (-) Transcript_38751:18-932(-)
MGASMGNAEHHYPPQTQTAQDPAATPGAAPWCDDAVDGCADELDGGDSRERKRRQRRRKVVQRARVEPVNGRHLADMHNSPVSYLGDNVVHARAQAGYPAQWSDGPIANFVSVVTPLVASKWHSSALSAGHLSEDGHVFAKARAGPRKSHSNGMTLSSLCMLFERNLRAGGLHRYCYTIMEGSVGAADGVGFVLDTRIRRTNIQRMRSVFLNKHGQVCIRNLDSIMKLPGSLPKLAEGISVYLTVDLDRATASFKMDDPTGKNCGTADLSFASLLVDPVSGAQVAAASGFFCAIVTGSITVSLH